MKAAQQGIPLGISGTICLVAILKDEEKFLDEWIVYHKMIGVSHFFLYDDNPEFPLVGFLQAHAAYTTVIKWTREGYSPGKSNQLLAYQHAHKNYILPFEWVIFIDGDEFIVLRQYATLQEFLADYNEFSAVSINWHLFGHNGYFDDPEDLVTSSLTRRMKSSSRTMKTISKTSDILEVNTAHYCKLKDGLVRVDTNKRKRFKIVYEGQTKVAHINHYMCRSFSRWMKRPERGDVYFDQHNAIPDHEWNLSHEGCLKKFVTSVAYNMNEYVDRYMLRYRNTLRQRISNIRMEQYTPLYISCPDVAKTFNQQLDYIAKLLTENPNAIKSTGLYNGKTGIAVFLFHYARYTGKGTYRDFANKYLDEIADTIGPNSIPGYAAGLSGIGTAIEYLVSNGFIDIDTDEVLEDIDALSYYTICHTEHNLNNSVHEGLTGLAHYVIARLNNPYRDPESAVYLQNITLLATILNALENSFDRCGEVLNRIGLLLEIISLNSQLNVIGQLNEAVETLAAMVFSDTKRTFSHPSELLHMGLKLLEASRLTGNESFKDKALLIINKHEKEFSDVACKYSHMVLPESLAYYCLYQELYLQLQSDKFSIIRNNYLVKSILDVETALSGIKSSDLNYLNPGLQFGLAGLGLSLLTALDRDEKCWPSLIKS